MKLTDNIYMIGSGLLGGFRFTNFFDCNIYMIDTGDGCIVVDSGGGLEPERIKVQVEKSGFKMSDIKILICTHYHVDHAGGAYYFAEQCGCKVYAPELEAACIRDGDEDANYTTISKQKGMVDPNYVFHAVPCCEGLKDGDEITLGNVTLKAIMVRGHSIQDMIVYGVIDGKKCMFVGDYVFCNGEVFLQPCPGCDLPDYAKFMNMLNEYEVDSLFPGHGVFAIEDGKSFIQKSLTYWNYNMLPPQLFLMK